MASLSSPSSSLNLLAKYDVFLSFRGEDTRDNFTSHLYASLRQKQIETFIDDERLRRGDEISPVLLKTIEESKISVIIFSKDYAYSTWCLDELAKIIECKKMNGQIVIPIFYHVNPSDVRKQTASFENAFVKHEERFKEVTEKVQRWKDALTEASNISGWNSTVIKPESKLVKEIVKDVWKKLNSMSPSSPSKDLLGIDSRIEEVMSLLCIGSTNSRVLGIWGMGGIGKTTIAEAVFREISSDFDGRTFIANVREASEQCGLVRLREQILSSILEEENLPGFSYKITQFMMARIRCKKVFIVLDDVNKRGDLEVLIGRLDQYGPGSRVIITTRDKHVLNYYSGTHVYEVKGYCDREALQIFCNWAFKQNHPLEDFMVLSKKIIDYCKGNPLALKVLGSSLSGMSKQEWQSELGKLKRISNPEIHNVLKTSYDGLDEEQRNIFLDIACFFKRWDFNYVIKILGGYYNSSLSGLEVLCRKSLVTKSGNLLKMHDLLQEMGWEIVRQESLKEPGKRSRLWYHEDVVKVLKNNKGTDKVEGMCLDVHKIRDVKLSSKAFANMQNLRFLNFYGSEFGNISKVHLPEGLDYLSEELRYLRWDGYPHKTLPSDFNPKNLLELHLPYSNIEQLWEGTMHASLLESINLQYCRSLVVVPSSIQYLDNLRVLNLSGCRSLKSFPMNIHFKSLKTLHLSECINLTKFTQILGDRIVALYLSGSAIEEVPSSIQYMKSLRVVLLIRCENLRTFESNIHFNSRVYLDLSDCFNLTKFPQISGNIVSINFSGTAIEEIPSSIDCLTELHEMYLYNCTRLRSISSSICKLKYLSGLNLQNCKKLQCFPEIPEKMEHVVSLSLDGSTAIKELPSSIENLKGLRVLRMRNCKNLETIPRSICNLTSLIEITTHGCLKLNNVPENLILLKKLNVSETAISQLSSSIPSWKGIESLDCSKCRGLVLPPLSSLCSLTTLGLSLCDLTKIPEDICNLASLEMLDLSGNNFDNLPSGIKQLSRLYYLNLSNCKELRSLPDLPFSLAFLEANNCERLQLLPEPISSLNELDASKSKMEYEEFSSYSKKRIDFRFINCPSLNQKAYNNILENIASYEKVYKQAPEIGFCISGSEIPNCFNYQSSGSSITVELPQHWSNESFEGVVVCAVILFEKPYYGKALKVWCDYHFGTDYAVKSYFEWNFKYWGMDEILIESDHMVVGYIPYSGPIYGRHTASFDFSVRDYLWYNPVESWKVKCCGVQPYNSMEKFAAPSEDVAEINGRAISDEEEVQPPLKRICRKQINTP